MFEGSDVRQKQCRWWGLIWPHPEPGEPPSSHHQQYLSDTGLFLEIIVTALLNEHVFPDHVRVSM